MGRPRKISAKTIRDFAKLMTEGNFLEAAAHKLGIPISTVYDWRKAGDEDQIHGRKSEARDFSEALKKAEGTAEVKALEKLLSVGEKPPRKGSQWTAFAWYLERRFPDRWGRRLHVETPDHEGSLEDLERKRADLAKVAKSERGQQIAAQIEKLMKSNGSGNGKGRRYIN